MEKSGWSRPLIIALVVVVLGLLGGIERAAGWLSGATAGDIAVALRRIEQSYSSVPWLGNHDFQNGCAVLAGLGVLWGTVVLVGHFLTACYRRRYATVSPPTVAESAPARRARNVPEKRAAQAAWKTRIDGLCNLMQGDPETGGEPIDFKKFRLSWQRSILDSFRDFLAPATATTLTTEFLERTSGIERTGSAGKDAVGHGLLYLKAKRDTMTDADLK